MGHMKAVLLYLVLVGAPVAGIYGIVCLGQDLKPPMSVAGAWNVELTPRTADTAPCKGFIVSSKSLILKVTQSGPHLALTLNDQSATRLSGEVNFASLTARSLEQIEATQGALGMTSPIQLEANIDRQSGLDRLSGTFTFANCPVGSELSFTAIRQQKGAGGGR
jgi:hypothetical protein